jgi:outer membrane receptor protein involved in Fe transport
MYGQQGSRLYAVTGQAVDSVTMKPLSYITANLRHIASGDIKKTVADSSGFFRFPKLKAGKYSLTVTLMGYNARSVNIALADTSGEVHDTGPIPLTNAGKVLSGVTVAATRPLVKLEIDRLIYDVEADPDSKALNLLDMLRKVPLISVDGLDKIQINGNANFRVLIDGRTSSVFNRNLSSVLRGMPAGNILRIEVITTPPSKYEGEGLAGIINIITNKRIADGYNGSVSAGYGSLYSSGAVSLNIKKSKFGFTLFSGINWDIQPRTSISNELYGLTPALFYFSQYGHKYYRNRSLYSEASISYEVDSLNLLTVNISLNGARDRDGTNRNAFMKDGAGNLLQSFLFNSTALAMENGFDAGLNYQHGFKKSKDRLLSFFYKFSRFAANQDNETRTADRINYFAEDFNQSNLSGIDEHLVQLDYVDKVDKITVEAGIKHISRGKFSDFVFERYDPLAGLFKPSPAQSDNFRYTQQITGIYNSYFLKLKYWGFRLGLRAEKTVIDADFAGSSLTVKQDYINLLPSVVVQHTLKKSAGNFRFAYSQRIQRPGINILNPFLNQADPRFFTSGNPDLQPVRNHNFEISFSRVKKATVFCSFNYAFARNTIQRLSVIGADSITRSTYQNVGKNDRLGMNFNMDIPITKKMNFTLNGGVSYVWLSGFVDGLGATNEGTQGFVFSYLNYKAKKDWRFSLRGGFYGPNITLQGSLNSYFYSSVIINKQFFKRKASLSAALHNPFQKYRKIITKLYTPLLTQQINDNQNFRNFSITVNYQFGKLKDQIKKNRRNITNDDKITVEKRN